MKFEVGELVHHKGLRFKMTVLEVTDRNGITYYRCLWYRDVSKCDYQPFQVEFPESLLEPHK
jgi:uncharacterized protein YodC (DUF2158 family)